MRALKRVLKYLLFLIAWIFVTLAVSIGAALAYEPLRSFGPTLYLLVGVWLLVLFGLWRLWRSALRIAIFATIALGLGGAALVTASSLSPAGKYAIGGCRGAGDEGTEDAYRELSGGVFYEVIDGRRYRMGSYYKKNGDWVLQIDRRDGVLDEQKLRFSLLGFDTLLPPIEGEEYRPTNFERRRLIPFTRPRWMPKWLE